MDKRISNTNVKLGVNNYCHYDCHINAFVTMTLLCLTMILFPLVSTAQISSYGSYDNLESVVFQVENMKPDEIKKYNSWAEKGIPEQARLLAINSARAQTNLIAAPATIVEFHYAVLKDTLESLNGLNEISISLINSTPKTIKEIAFVFSFKGGNNETIYDIKSGDKYCTLKFTNLKGRTITTDYKEVADGVMQSFHYLDYGKAAYCKPFFNKIAKAVHLESVNIQYADNTTSKKVSVFDKGLLGGENLYDNGPIQPVTAFIVNIDKNQGKHLEDVDDKIVDVGNLEEMPSFNGGSGALMKYIADNIKYPVVAKETGVQGRVVVSFIVEKDGSVSNVSVVRSVDPSLDREALRVIKSMPKWKPGRSNGKAARTIYNVPVSFRL